MGSSNSSQTKSVTLNKEDTVVRVSENVARRLTGKPELEEPEYSSSETLTPDEKDKISQLKSLYEAEIAKIEEKKEALTLMGVGEFEKAIQEVEHKFMTVTRPAVCEDLQKQIMECYSANKDRSLQCSSVAKAFSECVRKTREKTIIETQ
ncbi:DgyrCDS4734 [Dimorphilus gyrociliatus]|uniref:DgyrCDS4734 n=1 Tax=Dimorphilus gyrociliatus TaxID=2664684 RepID=A0A7I8VHW9_9ANNE|nr:DgyrCDS4734 [Dimorphilus gyrociliatus]